jgi:hypothetical protein
MVWAPLFELGDQGNKKSDHPKLGISYIESPLKWWYHGIECGVHGDNFWIIWINYSDFTATSLEMMIGIGESSPNSPTIQVGE